MSKYEKRKQEILDNALDLFVEKGYHETRTSEISEKVGIASGTLFNYFERKEEIINNLYIQIKTEIFSKIFTPKEPDEHIYSFLKRVWMNFVLWGVKNYNKILFILQMEDSPIISSEIKDKIEVKMVEYVSIYEEAVNEGFLKDVPVGLGMLLYYFGALSTIKYLYRSEANASEDKLAEYAEQGFNTYLYGIRL
jgi:AcrR family transcriptional regulator